jgi:hypothetical protein
MTEELTSLGYKDPNRKCKGCDECKKPTLDENLMRDYDNLRLTLKHIYKYSDDPWVLDIIEEAVPDIMEK